YPTVVNSPSGDTVLVVSAFEWGKYLGRLDVSFTADGKIAGYVGAPIFIDTRFAEDPTIAAAVAEFAKPIAQLRAKVIGSSRVPLEGTRAIVRSRETNLGNLICDALLWKTAAEGTQVCVTNGGGIRASIPAGNITMGQVLEVLPFGNLIATMQLRGEDLWAALENGVSRWQLGDGRFPQVGGMRYIFDPTRPAGSRIVAVQVRGADGLYRPLDMNAIYKVVTNDFMRRGGDGYTVFLTKAINPYDAGAVMADAVAEYIGRNSPVAPTVEGRILRFSAYR
ncbi:MAG: 5'-nucleotidase C-terminal domain-containing protein, partial [Anaerolineae bacterium]|nr:5'-nucleotidase C-terminal domain-containing protein [Anaerolineae bacterium]